MTPSLRSHPNHPQQPVSPPYTRNVRGNRYGSGHWLRHSLAGSPLLQTESGSLLFGTAGPPRAAPHPVSRRRSCLRLLSRSSSRDDSDSHWLISCMCVRTSARAIACRFRRPRRKPAGDCGMARRKIPTQYRTLFPAAGQRGRSSEHAWARVLPLAVADALPTTFSFTQRTKHFSNPKFKIQNSKSPLPCFVTLL